MSVPLFQILSLFPGIPSKYPASFSGIPLHCDIKPSQEEGTLRLLISTCTILFNICCWNHCSLHWYSLVFGLVPGRPGCTSWFILLFLLCNRKFTTALIILWNSHNNWKLQHTLSNLPEGKLGSFQFLGIPCSDRRENGEWPSTNSHKRRLYEQKTSSIHINM